MLVYSFISFHDFGFRVHVKNEAERISSFPISWKYLLTMCIFSPLNGRNHQQTHLVMEFSFRKIFDYNWVCVIDVELFSLSVTSWVSFGSCCISKNEFHITCHISWHELLIIFPYHPYNVLSMVFQLLFPILVVCVFSLFFLIFLMISLLILLIKEPVLVSLFSLFFSCYVSFISALSFIIPFLLLTLHLSFSFWFLNVLA